MNREKVSAKEVQERRPNDQRADCIGVGAVEVRHQRQGEAERMTVSWALENHRKVTRPHRTLVDTKVPNQGLNIETRNN